MGANITAVRSGTSSKFKGIYWEKDTSKWRAIVRCNSIGYHIGRFKSEEDAARAYNVKALELFGEFARLNDLESVDA